MNKINKFIAFLLCTIILFTGINLFYFPVNASTTTVDLTGLSSGAETSHDCSKYLTTKYDSSQHWQECTVCGKLYGNKTPHSLTTTGIAGSANRIIILKYALVDSLQEMNYMKLNIEQNILFIMNMLQTYYIM